MANVRGTKYNVTCATVWELCRQVNKQTGLNYDEQAVLYHGKLLKESDDLQTAGLRNRITNMTDYMFYCDYCYFRRLCR